MLSQAEIDALLSGSLELEDSSKEESVNLKELMGTGEEKPEVADSIKTTGGRNIRPYNFWSPDHFSKEHLRAVELVHEDLAERLTATLPSYLLSLIHI